ncbi:MAG: hypothetical protein HPY44_16405 [Armatimonadetes bacterium]|nr:hypothetical protein [Armatimonadota bacterium]
MPNLPRWLLEAKDSVPRWLSSLAHPSGPGRYRFATDAFEPFDLDSTSMAYNIRSCLGMTISDQERTGWIDYLCSMQRPEDGLMIDEGMERHIITTHAQPTAEEVANVRRWTTRNGIMTLLGLGGRPPHRLHHAEAFRSPAEIVDYMESLHWHNPWGAGSWAGAAIIFQNLNRLMGDENAPEIIAAGVDWLVKHQDPETGAWSDGSDIALNVLINGIFKVWIQVLNITDMPVQYPERVVDLCLRGFAESPALRDTPDACSIFDVAYVLDIALRHCDYRRDEVAEVTSRCFDGFLPLLRPDGAFSYGPGGSLANHGGLQLAPVKDQADITGTALVCSALSLLANLCGAREELGWVPWQEWAGVRGQDATTQQF